ncbi:MAG TPA: hypothetical protein VHX86_05345 [Tepidisphaeraceae bacterium]|jgi:hypothetical protein|nr:hypothetical protein [Tepidisphaeraceae bacterium]
MYDVPKDLGRRIVEAARLAVAIHLQRTAEPFSPRTRPSIGGADCYGGAVLDGGAADGGAPPAPLPAISIAGTLAESEAE